MNPHAFPAHLARHVAFAQKCLKVHSGFSNAWLLLLFVFVAFDLSAQSYSREGVSILNARGAGVIVQGDQVRGYYFFYRTDKQDARHHNYVLSVHDENLREIKVVEIVRPKTYVLVDGVFNGEAFGFLFFDYDRKYIELVSYDKNLESHVTISRKIGNKAMLSAFQSVVNNGSLSQQYLVPISNVGFLYYGIKEGSKYEYEIQCYDNDLQVKWSQYSGGGARVRLAADAFQHGNYVGSIVSLKTKISSRKSESHLLVHEVLAGKQLFSVPLVADRYALTYSNVSYDEKLETFSAFGEYYERGRESGNNSLGFMILVFDRSGNLLSHKTLSWAEISMKAPVNDLGRFNGVNSRILFHEFVRTGDGSIFAIGEQYKKVVSGWGIVGNALAESLFGSGDDHTYYDDDDTFASHQLNVYNMVIFEFAPDANLRKVHVFEKDKNIFYIRSEAEDLSARAVAYYAKAHGGFDYAFSQQSDDRNNFHIAYVNREKGTGRNLLATITCTPEKNFVVDSMPLDRRAAFHLVLPAKEGYVMVTDYYVKEKRVDSFLVKVEY